MKLYHDRNKITKLFKQLFYRSHDKTMSTKGSVTKIVKPFWNEKPLPQHPVLSY